MLFSDDIGQETLFVPDSHRHPSGQGVTNLDACANSRFLYILEDVANSINTNPTACLKA
jgi:hypothetical protein